MLLRRSCTNVKDLSQEFPLGYWYKNLNDKDNVKLMFKTLFFTTQSIFFSIKLL